MRGLAFGIHDPDGERHRLAQLHYRECPACRSYVLSLRGLAAVLPPLALPWAPGMVGGLGGALGGGAGSSAVGVGGAAGTGAAGGWLPMGGSLSVKLATGCLLFAGVGGGCVALVMVPPHSKHASPRHDYGRDSGGPAPGIPLPGVLASFAASPIARGSTTLPALSSSSSSSSSSSLHRLHTSSAVPPVGAAQRELGFERPATRRTSSSSGSAQAATAAASYARPTPDPLRGSPSKSGAESHTGSAPPRGAESEFGPG
jgi:hypothetical protein